ncbi:hypothetical protein FA13DRAFT_1740427 [Coprinellus micaceus]|uniref:NACHT domain-containing protein n=1 Tax=Coprinellus micaceus TaxID=71717 RepID=A0A4Y7SMR7_COPMI|nr:hypothetical protein FA13DRAFT_1740427 [Coprinellus micaceus]
MSRPTYPRHFCGAELNIVNVARDYHNRGIAITTINSDSGSRALDRLLGHVAHGAVHDSAERGPDAPKCHPETRVAVQKDIMGWIEHGERDDAPKRILWLSGPAGSGKTAIAGTIADECYKRGLLAASFFFSAFSGSMDRRLSKSLISTLVYSLTRHKSIVGLKEEVLSAVEDDPIIFERHLDQQLDTLILKPLRNVSGRSERRYWPAVIIVDGLDECQGSSESDIGPGGPLPALESRAQKEILVALLRACADTTFPFRIIVVSRPEPVIRHFFSTSACPTLNMFLDDKYDPDSDIRLFLGAMFNDLRPSGQFIYAATVICFLDNPRLGSPQQLLTRLLEWRRLNDSRPFAPLDLLYDRILRTSPDPLLAVKWIHVVKGPRPRDLPLYSKYLLESYPEEAVHVLGTLQSLVSPVDENGEPGFHVYHKSLYDFLDDPQRSSDLHVNEESFHHFARDRYYQTLQDRGPQSQAADHSTDPPPLGLFHLFCFHMAQYVDPYCKYTSGDVEWWLHHFGPALTIPMMFSSIHKLLCKWYCCLPACGVWRKGILRHCSKHGWRVPTRKEALHDRFNKIPFYGQEMYPLQPPEVESAKRAFSNCT